MSDKRINFPQKVIAVIADRANRQCSVPRCTRPAIGPALDDAVYTINMGTACHIYSAAEGGPRGRGGKSEEWIASAENGIWCCGYHGNRIDKRKGREFPPDVLLAWKALAEARVAKQMNDQPSPLGWVESVEVESCKLFTENPRMELSRFTLVCGEEGSGKSLLFEIAASVSNSKHGARLVKSSGKPARPGYLQFRTTAAVAYSTVDHHAVKLALDYYQGKLSRDRNGTTLTMPPDDIEVVYYPSELRANPLDGEDDLQFLMRVLSVDESTLLAMCGELRLNSLIPGEFCFEQGISDKEEDDSNTFDFHVDGSPWMEMNCRLEGKEFRVTFRGLSHSEKLRILISLFIAKAREISRRRLTLLLLDTDSINFDEKNFKRLLGFLLEQPFQVAIVVPNCRFANVIDVDETAGMALKSHDYLERWSLSVIRSKRNRIA